MPQRPGPSREVRRRRTVAGGLVLLVAASSVAGLRHRSGDVLTANGTFSTGGSDSTAAGTASTTPTASATSSVASGPGAGFSSAPVTTAASASRSVVVHGSGTLRPVALTGTSAATGRTVTVGLDVEDGMGIDSTAFARDVSRTLLDPRGWQGVDHVHFVFVTPAQRAAGTEPDAIVTLASPDTVDKLCAPARTNGQVSCANGGRAVLNARRWLLGVPYYKNLDDYREYMVSHEVGHLLGHGHQTCPGAGKPAPVMQQQTLGLHGCTAWPWPWQP